MTKPTRKMKWLVAAALAAMPVVLLPGLAQAQQQQPADGRALDANNRIGSGGVNTYRPAPTVGVFGNQVINGNVSQGRAFHGSLTYNDPNEFHGFQFGRVTDNFARDSTGVGVPNTPPPVPNFSTPFYPESRFAPPPQPGYVPSANAPGYVPAQPIIVQPNDLRLGAHLDAQPTGGVPKPGELVLPGPVDPTSKQQTLLTGSPLTGFRQLNAGEANDVNYLNRFTGMGQSTALDRMQITAADLQRMRGELRVTANNNGSAAPALGQPLGQSLEAPGDAALSGNPLNSAIASSAFTGNISSDQGLYNKLLGTPSNQSSQYDELKKRLERYQTEHKTTAEIAAGKYNAAMHKKEAEGIAGKQPGDNKQPTDTTVVPGKQTAKPAPLAIKSLATGVNAAGLKEMLAKAEALMKEGKFSTAIDQYAAAEQVAPNQPLVWIGRANAELGAGFYNRAEAHLKQAFASDRALLMAQYDLKSFLGEERLQSVVKDLKEIATTNQQSPTPVFLLAYILYNTGDTARAAGYLDLAEKRSGGKDPTYKLLREHWSLPATNESKPESKELNK